MRHLVSYLIDTSLCDNNKYKSIISICSNPVILNNRTFLSLVCIARSLSSISPENRYHLTEIECLFRFSDTSIAVNASILEARDLIILTGGGTLKSHKYESKKLILISSAA